MNKLLLAAAAACVVAGSANAATTVQTSGQLADANVALGGLNTTTTTTNANGRTTTSTGAFRYSDANAAKDVWQQQNVGGGGIVGITNDYARNGNGSAFFASGSGNYKSDLEIMFSKAVPLSEVTSLSYDALRDGSSGAAKHLVNSLRLIMGNADGTSAGTYLIFEPVYNANPVSNPLPENVWNTFSITGSTTVYANNGNLNEPANTGTCAGCYASLDAWKAANPALTVLGLSTGIGSGWPSQPNMTSTYRGAVDNVTFTTAAASTTWNFEVAATAAVPEPASWAMMIGGIGLTGGVLRRRRGAALATA